MIHCIGDSHSAVFSGVDEMTPIWPQRSKDTLPYFRSYRIGAATAYQLATKIPIIDDIIAKAPILKTDKILFIFGEVDVRAHLIKQQIEQQRTLSDVVEECVNRYFEVIKHYKEQGYNVAVFGPIASWHPSKQYTGGPSFGTCEERNIVTSRFNNYLKNFCSDNDIEFTTIFYDMIDLKFITKPEYLDDWEGSHIHLLQKAMPLILNEFKRKNLI